MRIFHPWVKRNLLHKTLIFVILTLSVIGLVLWRHDSAMAPGTNQKSSSQSSGSNQGQTQTSFNKSLYSINDPGSLWVVVNKGRVLPSNFAPQLASKYELRSDASNALDELFSGAMQAGYDLRLYSGYRSYSNQVAAYNGYVKIDGQAKADTYSARPGHSEHQTGLAADLSAASGKCSLQICFGDLPEGQWLAANAYKYGFVIRYQKGQESLTGYQYEPWHVRYVGTDLSAQIKQTGQTLEQFFGLPIYTDYPASQYELKIGS